jgi:hypothetical protein
MYRHGPFTCEAVATCNAPEDGKGKGDEDSENVLV